MSKPGSERFFDSFCRSLCTVLAQYSGKDWSVSACDASNRLELWIDATASGCITGKFAFGIARESAIVLAQLIAMQEQAPAEYGDEEREALAELLRQVCGHAATCLGDGEGEAALSIISEGALAWAISVERCFRFTDGSKTATLALGMDAELLASLQDPVVGNQTPSIAESRTDHSALQQALNSTNLNLLMDVRLGVRLRFGTRRMKLREILEFHPGTIVELDRQVQEPVDLLVDNKVIAKGEVVIVDGNYGLRVSNVLSPKQCVEALY